MERLSSFWWRPRIEWFRLSVSIEHSDRFMHRIYVRGEMTGRNVWR
jgi:hypothetical protein